jgi:pimeloyl-ACP methyl ester carboxylesterase
VYCHGFPSSRLEAEILDGMAREAGLAIIAPDRPGIGLSDFQAERRILDWPADVRELLTQLGIDRFALIGCSAGFPYAAACACRLSAQVVGVASLGGLGSTADRSSIRQMGPAARLAFRLVRRNPRLFELAFGGLGWLAAKWPDLVAHINRATPPDRRVLERPEVRRHLRRTILEAFRQGIDGPLHELRLLAQPWGFDPARIPVRLDIWHGCEDGVVPPAMARHLAKRVPGARLRLLPDEGHISLAYAHGADLLRALRPSLDGRAGRTTTDRRRGTSRTA